MALPVSINTNTLTGEQNSYHGPFKSSGGSFYTILPYNEGSSGFHGVSAWKATDPTSSFTQQDSADRPAFGTSTEDIASLWVHQSGDLLNIVGQNNATNEVWFAQFNMAADAWVDLGASDFVHGRRNGPSTPRHLGFHYSLLLVKHLAESSWSQSEGFLAGRSQLIG